MTEFAEASDVPERDVQEGEPTPPEQDPGTPPVERQQAEERDAEERDASGPQAPSPAEEEPCGPVIAAAEAQQSSQGALFGSDVPPVTQPAEEDESVTAFGGQPDDLAAIRAELGSDVPGAQPEAAEAEVETEAVSPEVAETQAEAEAEAAVTEAGVPAGADDEPEAVEALLDAESAAGLLEPSRDRTLSAPFLAYDAVWLLFSIVMVVALQPAAVANKLDTAPSYPLFVLVGLVLTVLGPILALFLWWMKRSKTPKEERGGLLSVALLRGALATFAGVVMWWIALVVLNYFKTGRFF